MDAYKQKMKIKRILFGRNEKQGLVQKIVLYILLIGISFIFLYPLLSMFAKSLMTLEDLINTSVSWIPRNATFANYKNAFVWMQFFNALWDSVQVSRLWFRQIQVSAKETFDGNHDCDVFDSFSSDLYSDNRFISGTENSRHQHESDGFFESFLDSGCLRQRNQADNLYSDLLSIL
jgi:hypothetical protein